MPGSSKRRLFKIPMTSVFPICNYSLDSCWSSQNLKSNILNKQRGVHFIQRQDLIINHRAMYIFCKHIISLRASRTWNHFHSMHNMWFVLVWPARIYSSHTVSLHGFLRARSSSLSGMHRTHVHDQLSFIQACNHITFIPPLYCMEVCVNWNRSTSQSISI